MIRTLKFFVFTFIMITVAFLLGCQVSDPPQKTASPPLKTTSLPLKTTSPPLKTISPPETIPVQSVSIEDLVADTAIEMQNYEGRIVKVNGTVNSAADGTDSLTLETNRDDIVLWVRRGKTENNLHLYREGENYDFTLFIERQHYFNSMTVIWTHLATTAIKQVTMKSLTDDVIENIQNYIGCPIRITATVSANVGDSFSLDTSKDRFMFLVDKNGHPYEDRYLANRIYTLTLFVTRYSERDTGSYTVNMSLVRPVPETTMISPLTVSLEEIVDNTIFLRQNYQGKIVKLNGTVQYRYDKHNSLTLETNKNNASFYVNLAKTPSTLDQYQEGENYDFILFIYKQEDYLLIERRIWTYLVETTEIKRATIESLITDAIQDPQKYVGNPIRITANVVNIDAGTNTIFLDSDELVGMKNNFGFVIDKNLHPDGYLKGQTYTFMLFVYSVREVENSTLINTLISMYPIIP